MSGGECRGVGDKRIENRWGGGRREWEGRGGK